MGGSSRRVFLVGALAPAVLAMAGCQSVRPSGSSVYDLGLPPIALDVAQIEVVDAYAPPGGGTHIEHLVANPPSAAIRDWATNRLVAAGRSGSAVLVIERASLEEVADPRPGGVGGMFSMGWRYTLQLAVRLELRGVPGVTSAFARADVERRARIGDLAGPAERARIQEEIVADGIVDLDRQMQSSIRQYLARAVRN